MLLILRSSFSQSHASKKQRDGERAMAMRITTATRMMMMMILPPVFLQLLLLLLLMLSTFRCCSCSVTCCLPVPCFLSCCFFFSFFPSDCCFSGVLFHQGSVQAAGSGLGRLPFGERVSLTPFLFRQFRFDQKSEEIVRTARALFFLISRIFVFFCRL